MPRSSDIDAALIGYLAGDAELTAAMPDGVWMNQGPPNLRNFVLVAIGDHTDTAKFGARAIEDTVYWIQAVSFGTSRGPAKTAAARIDALLENHPLTVAEYGWMMTAREGRIDETEPDETDESIVWQHIGGKYRIQMTPLWPEG